MTTHCRALERGGAEETSVPTFTGYDSRSELFGIVLMSHRRFLKLKLT